MHQLTYLRRQVEAIAQLGEQMRQVESDENKNDARARLGPGEFSLYPYLFGQMSAHVSTAVIAAQSALQTLEALDTLAAGVDLHLGTDPRTRTPYLTISIPQHVELTCPRCQHIISCSVERDDEIDSTQLACYVASIDTERCEECREPLCPACERHPHPEDSDLILCGACHAAKEVSANV